MTTLHNLLILPLTRCPFGTGPGKDSLPRRPLTSHCVVCGCGHCYSCWRVLLLLWSTSAFYNHTLSPSLLPSSHCCTHSLPLTGQLNDDTIKTGHSMDYTLSSNTVFTPPHSPVHPLLVHPHFTLVLWMTLRTLTLSSVQLLRHWSRSSCRQHRHRYSVIGDWIPGRCTRRRKKLLFSLHNNNKGRNRLQGLRGNRICHGGGVLAIHLVHCPIVIFFPCSFPLTDRVTLLRG